MRPRYQGARPIIHSFVRSFIHSNPSYSNARSKGRLVQADGLSHTEEYAIRYRRKINVPQLNLQITPATKHEMGQQSSRK